MRKYYQKVEGLGLRSKLDPSVMYSKGKLFKQCGCTALSKEEQVGRLRSVRCVTLSTWVAAGWLVVY
jgi:hypothetical protein